MRLQSFTGSHCTHGAFTSNSMHIWREKQDSDVYYPMPRFTQACFG